MVEQEYARNSTQLLRQRRIRFVSMVLTLVVAVVPTVIPISVTGDTL